ncbi:MAG: iron ABC transporter permease [Nitrospirales bacterium]|nr:iron ABC transporter permease [Nitrospira sp.]MDR4500329.1 iron ABC transporter permease [Nitrospirales bacterium]
MTARSWRQGFFSPLSLFALTIACTLAFPLFYVGYSAFSAKGAVWQRLWSTRIPELLFNTVTLAIGVGATTLIIGVALAWFVTRYDFWGRRVWEWAIVLPLAIPSYVLAYIYTYLLETGGFIEQGWQWMMGAEARIFSPYSFGGAWLVMTLNTFPYIYLLARAALQNVNLSFEEAAQALGATRWQTLTRVSLPLIRPSLVAGLFLVTLYVVSDFGAVSLLRFQTFTYAIYQQMTSRYDYAAASILSLLLVVFAFLFLIAERWFRQRSRFFQTGGHIRMKSPKPCGMLPTLLLTAFMLMVFGAAFGIPVFLLIHWTWAAWNVGEMGSGFLSYIWNSAMLSGTAASIAIVVGTPLAFLASRYPTRFNLLYLQGAYTGYVLPGPVAALALLTLFTQNLPFLYGTALVLILAYLIHFLPAGLQAMESAIQQVNPNIEEAARSLGRHALSSFWQVTFPLVRGGFIVAWILMFLQAMKELPATLLLRPVGFDTLSVRIWLEASEELYQLAAPPALLIILITLPVVLLLTKKNWQTT